LLFELLRVVVDVGGQAESLVDNRNRTRQGKAGQGRTKRTTLN
jgi:hypothetical protein